ncbi:MAG: hypothetical protein KDB64_04965 [Solirubrobacterales bacterium]|nr:hypothetical protein [Solirubrobacterales bacterium]MCB0862485.1 hypothetical protein [Solirubrobacterales bacterium]MCB8916103.1 hypothetical protein [Thermoleophilales bacterium]
MSEQSTVPVSIDQYLSQPLTVGEPITSGPLTIFPVFGPDPGIPYVSLKDAIENGNLTVKELPGGASVRDLVVENPGRHNVLVFEGEEVLGARQNRTFDISVLIPSGARITVPVSCVEAGRWDGMRHGEAFASSPQTADPRLRGSKVRQSHRARMAGQEARADQSEVWMEVSERAREVGVSSPTESLNDVHVSRGEQLRRMVRSIELQPGQVGMIAAAGDEIIAADLVSRPEVFEELFLPLLHGYALDALASGAREADVSAETAREFIDHATSTRILEGDGIGMGRDFRFEEATLVGAGLISGEELIQFSVFPAERQSDRDRGNDARPVAQRRTRIRRPSQRRDS